MSKRIEGKVAIITGAASGFGHGIAERFAEEGAKIVVADLNDDLGQKVVADLNTQYGEGSAIYLKTDVTNEDQVKAMIDVTVKTYGKLDIMVNNAGVSHKNQSMMETDDKMADLVWTVNVKAIWLIGKYVVPQFQKQGGGVIINNASSAALRPRPGLTLYNASKAAAVNLTKTMALELAKDKIRVNALCPVACDTPLLATFMGGDSPELRQKFIDSVPLGRFSKTRDLANAALYLASDDAEFITGVALEVDGGRCV